MKAISNNYSIAAAYSFYPGKNLGAWGDGGAVTTNNKKLYEKILLLRNWGSVKKYYHEELGFNSRLQPLQGVVLSEKINCGIVWINCWMLRDLRVPFGGMKASGIGREGGDERGRRRGGRRCNSGR